MKKINKKGFTLIELMAVVIILIVIIFIAINKINDSSQKTRNNAMIANAGSYIKAVNGYIAEQTVVDDRFDSGVYSVKEIESLGINISGTKPSSGAVGIKDGEVVSACLIIEGSKLEYKNEQVSDPKTGDCEFTSVLEDFSYTGKEQSYTIPKDGYYRIELWGAQGGGGANGAYTSGDIYLDSGTVLYFYVGGEGPTNETTTNVGGYNGGGYSGSNQGQWSYGGGGATDVRLVDGVWSNELSLRSRIMVAAGGAGGVGNVSNTIITGAGGALIGLAGGGNYNATNPGGGKQTTYGASQDNSRHGFFGYAMQSNTSGFGGGGGGGYWGGSNGYGKGGAGGSSFISGHIGAVAVISADSSSPRLNSSEVTCAEDTTDIVCSYHYSGKIFVNTVMKAGNESMPAHQGKTKITGNTGNGYAKISGLYSKDLEEEMDSYNQD